MFDVIKFILNDEVREVSGLPPTMTVLQWLRTQAGLTGTKEGCAEGDCGACTTILGTLKDGKVEYKTINSCIVFLPVLDGHHLITVENLKKNGTPHPVQKAMVDCHGSQCGFCTPGFVMSLAALHHNKQDATEEEIQDAIAGNLCRCTGYRPILDAARKADKVKKRAVLASDIRGLREMQRKSMFTYEGGGGKFFAPRGVQELADVLAKYPTATMLAGGTDVGLWVTKHHKELQVIIYTGHVRELQEIKSTASGLEIGAAVTYTDVFKALAAYDESMEETLRRLGSVQIRNLGTVGGNIANGSPIGDGMPPLIALDAKIFLRNQNTARLVNLKDYFIEYGKQDRKPGEFVEKILVPAKAKNVLFKVYKISKRFDQDISAVCGAFALTMEGKKITAARIAYGGMAGTPKRAAAMEKALTGKEWTEETAKAGMAALDKDFQPMSDMRASKEYRSDAAKNLLYRFWLETTQPEIETRVYNYAQY
ncbi:MAG TPA: xanthine dehydrogenase small subunit [Patescibacteria group bacterium]|nr:xanthine dehydrogenase small subunit [Patescibacteria group bacterium]